MIVQNKLTVFLATSALILLITFGPGCAKVVPPVDQLPQLVVILRTDSGKAFPGATVRLYKNAADTGITMVSDSTGIVWFKDLDPVLYYWFAQKDCKNNRVSQVSVNRPLLPNIVLYGTSVLSETGTLKIINNSATAFKVSDSLFNTTVKRDTPYIAAKKVGVYRTRSESVSTPGVFKDTVLRIRCGDTTVLRLPY